MTKAREFNRLMRRCRTCKERGLLKRRWKETRQFCKHCGFPIS